MQHVAAPRGGGQSWRRPETELALCVSHPTPLFIARNPQVTHTTELSKVDIAFRLLRLDNAYVCNAGRLVGVITRDSLADFVDQREVSPMDDCLRCGRATFCFFSRFIEMSTVMGNLDLAARSVVHQVVLYCIVLILQFFVRCRSTLPLYFMPPLPLQCTSNPPTSPPTHTSTIRTGKLLS